MDQVYIKISENYTATIRDINSLKNHPDLKPSKIKWSTVKNLEIVGIYDGTSKKFIDEIEQIIGQYKKPFAPDTLEIYINQANRSARVIHTHNKGMYVEYTMPEGRIYKGFVYWNGTYISYSKMPKKLKRVIIYNNKIIW